MQTNLITTAEFEEVSFDHVDFVVALSVREELDAYSLGMADARDNLGFVPEMYFVKQVDMLNFALGYLEVKPDDPFAGAMANELFDVMERDADADRQEMRYIEAMVREF